MKIPSPTIAETTAIVAVAMRVVLEGELIIVVIRVALLCAVIGETLSLSQDEIGVDIVFIVVTLTGLSSSVSIKKNF